MPDPIRQEQANNALQSSGLGSIAGTVGTPFPDAAPLSALDTFADHFDGPPMAIMQLMRSSTRALQLVISNRTPTPAGPVRFHSTTLAMNLIAMANLLKHMAAEQGRPYPDTGNPWGQVVAGIWRVISPDIDRTLDALVVPGTIISALSRQFAFDVDSPLAIFFSNDAAEADLAMLIGMAVEDARREYREETAHRDMMDAARRAAAAQPASSGSSSRMRDRLFRRFR